MVTLIFILFHLNFFGLFTMWHNASLLSTTDLNGLVFVSSPRPGALPGAAEQDAGDQVEPAAGADYLPLQHRRHVRGLHRQPSQTARWPGQWEDEAGGRAQEHAGLGRGLQEQVSWLNRQQNEMHPGKHAKHENYKVVVWLVSEYLPIIFLPLISLLDMRMKSTNVHLLRTSLCCSRRWVNFGNPYWVKLVQWLHWSGYR